MAKSRKVEVLIVGSDTTELARMKSWFREAHYHVVSCSSFLAARRFLARRVPYALITDIRLGPFNGLQLVYLAREKRPGVTVAVLADDEDPVLRSEAAHVGAAFLLKPVTRDELLTTLSGIRRD